jgi:hypothetical protein
MGFNSGLKGSIIEMHMAIECYRLLNYQTVCLVITHAVGIEDHSLERGMCSLSSSMIQMVKKKYF